jgi:hypothetical protein
MSEKIVKKRSWPASNWNGLWKKWSDIPCEYRALLLWGFLTSGPIEKEEYFQVMLALEQWDYSRFSVFREFEIKWITAKIQNKCPEMNYKFLDLAIVIFLNIGSSGLTLKDRRTVNTPRHKDLNMIKSLNLNSDKFNKSWEWMESWYVKNHNKQCTIEFEEWFSCEINRINEWENQWPSVFPDLASLPFNPDFPFLHQGRSFPIDASGTEIQKTIRLVPSAPRPSNAWGYILRTPEPEIPHDPFPYYPPLIDKDWYRWFLSQDFIHEWTSYVGGPSGLLDYAHEMREAEKVLRKPNRQDSPMSKIVLI